MSIIVKNKDTLIFDNFIFRCCVGKNGFSKNKTEGDKRTPVGNFKLNCLYYRADRKKKPLTKLKLKIIKKQMGWCDDINSKKYYNKLIKTSLNLKHEKLFRKDYKYDLLIPIKYNFLKPVKFKGSCIFIHLTNNYKPTLGCVAMKKKDFLIMLKLINKKAKIKIV